MVKLLDVLGGGIVKGMGDTIDALFTSDEERLRAETEMMKVAIAPDLGQIEINKVEAAHRSLFVAGWRPFIGWVCGIALCYNYLLYPLILWAKAVWFPDVVAPDLFEDSLYQLVIAMLGLGGLRTFEKLKGKVR